jgi:hypothetical protein
LFPDLPNDVVVYLVPSLFSFNGKVAKLPSSGRAALFIGVDFVAKRNDNLDVLFSHEFFHAYHDGKIATGDMNSTMASPLWKEGFATYVSGLLNPTQPLDVLLMDKVLAEDCKSKDKISDMAKAYLPLLETDGETTYEDWFLMSGPTRPTRRGYCLGYFAVQEIAKSHDLSELTTWSEKQVSSELKNVLEIFGRLK